jgi:ATP-dependent DNA helicase RecG
MPEERADEVWGFVRKQVEAGRQAYIVYPVIEGEKDDQPELDFAREEEAGEAAELEGGGRKSAYARMTGRSGREADPAPSAKDDTFSLSANGSGSAHAARKVRRKIPERTKLRSATDMFEQLHGGGLKGLRLGLLHGRMSADEKDVAMARFKRGEIDVLVSTTVIEVGVDVPNATVMVIEHAERFGLAQMHQLRGRVGRGTAKSYCVLLTGAKISDEAEQRLEAMVRTQNGFELAELDLQQRGPGEFFGTRQAGLPEFRVADLVRDRELLELAKSEAARFVERARSEHSNEEVESVWARLKQQWQRRYGLVEA